MAIVFYQKDATVYAVHYKESENPLDVSKLEWLFSGAKKVQSDSLESFFVGPRREMITPWSTNAVEITQNMGISGILRIEEFTRVEDEKAAFDPMLQAFYKGLNQDTFTIDKKPDPIVYIEDIRAYNQQEGLALNEDEISYLEGLSKKLNRRLTDSEVFGFSQVNSEHCRHKIFGGTFIIDGEEQEEKGGEGILYPQQGAGSSERIIIQDMAPGVYDIEVQSLSPFEKTLKGTFVIPEKENDIFW